MAEPKRYLLRVGETRDVVDACGQTVAVGDVVATTSSYGRVGLTLAVVMGFTATRAILYFKDTLEKYLGSPNHPDRNIAGWAANKDSLVLTPQHRPQPEVLQWLDRTAQP